MKTQNLCLHCGEKLIGRSDKRYCNQYCKSAYQYQKSISEQPLFYKRVDTQLKKNRKILKEFNKAGKATIRESLLLEQGFDPNYFTHYWKNQKGDVYLFVYEYGFLKRTENSQSKFVLIQWQHYMEKLLLQ